MSTAPDPRAEFGEDWDRAGRIADGKASINMRLQRERQAREDERLDALHAAWTRIAEEADEALRIIEKRAGRTRLQIRRRIADRSERRRLEAMYGHNWQQKVSTAEGQIREGELSRGA